MNSTLNGSPPAPTMPGATHAERLHAALARLDASRQVLRGELLPDDGAGQADAEGRPGRASPWRLRWRQLRRAVHRWPLASVATEALQRWWQSHPWYLAGNVLAEGVLEQARPLVRRHPVASVLGAAALGAAVVAGRPWRWPLLRDQLRPLPGGVSRWLMVQLGSAPVQTALASLLLMAVQPQAPDDGSDDGPQGEPDKDADTADAEAARSVEEQQPA